MEILHSAAMMPMITIADWLKLQIKDARTVVIAVASLIVLVGMLARMVKHSFSLSSIISAAVVGALAGWLVIGGGIDTLSSLFNQQSKLGS